MAKRKLTLQQHLDSNKYGSRFKIVLRYLTEDYDLDIDEIASDEEVLLIIALSLEQYISPKLIAEQVDAKLKEKEEEEIEPISAPIKSVGMFESDIWEHEIPRAPMHGPWTLPPAKGGFLHTPRIESPRSSPHYVPAWQKIRIYAQDHPEKTITEIAKDLGQKPTYVAVALRGTIEQPHTKHAQANPGLPRIHVTVSEQIRKSLATKKLTGYVGDQTQSYEKRQEITEEITNAFIERMIQDEERDQYEIVLELAKEYNMSPATMIRYLGDTYDSKLMLDQRIRKRVGTVLAARATSYKEIEQYLREFGSEATDNEISVALNISPQTVTRRRRELGIPNPEVGSLGYKEGPTITRIRKILEENPELKSRLFEEGYTHDIRDIANEVGVSWSMAYQHVKRLKNWEEE